MFKNILLLNTNGEPKEILKKLEVFQPDFLGGYTGMLSHLALLQEKGFGRISPEKVASMGSCLDRKLREFIEKAFNADVFEVYGSTESGPVAFECEFGNLHINEDMVYLETLGEKAGRVRVTKLYGEGTPMLRYDGMNDIVKLNEKNCGCGIEGKVIEKIYSRENLSIFRRDGGVLTDSVFAKIFSPLIYKLKTTKVKATKAIQHSLDKIEVKVTIDEKEDDVDEEEILSEIEDNLKRILGDVEINIKKVKRLSKRTPMVTSRVNRNGFSRLFYL